MLVFSNSKINLGLHVVNKRPDGFHSIETVFYPVDWCDILEVIDNKNSNERFTIGQSGIKINGPIENNLLFKAWQLISAEKDISQINVHLHKNIPMGAGLGGGSADAAYFINLLNRKFKLGYSDEEKTGLASKLGSDCAFFIKNKPVLARGKGTEFSEVKVDLSAYYILLVYPGIHSDTREAYEGLVPKQPAHELKTIIESSPVGQWKNTLVNDFENSIFKKYPDIRTLKEKLYERGALYASLSGSGSAVFGIFNREPDCTFPSSHSFFLQKPLIKIL